MLENDLWWPCFRFTPERRVAVVSDWCFWLLRGTLHLAGFRLAKIPPTDILTLSLVGAAEVLGPSMSISYIVHLKLILMNYNYLFCCLLLLLLPLRFLLECQTFQNIPCEDTFLELRWKYSLWNKMCGIWQRCVICLDLDGWPCHFLSLR